VTAERLRRLSPERVTAHRLAGGLTVMQVFFRYVLNNSLPLPEEAARLGFVWMVFPGMAIAAHHDAHLRIVLLLLFIGLFMKMITAMVIMVPIFRA